MTTAHEQAMNNVYQQVLQRLMKFFSRAERTALRLLIQRLAVAAGGMEQIGNYKVLVIQSGSRDSCYTLALLRAAQLTIATQSPTTFQLRVATLRLNSTSSATLDNIDRTYSALFVHDDPRVEVVMVDNREVLPFDPVAPMSKAGRESNRMNMLMIGHRRASDESFELWDDGFLATGEFYGQIARWNHGVDALVSGDSPRQQKQFIEGLIRAAAKAGIPLSSQREPDFSGLFAHLDELGSDSYRVLYGELGQMPWRPAHAFEACRRTTFIGIHDIVVSNLQERWPLLSEFLRYKAERLPAQLSDHEYVSPATSAHIHGLQACFVQQQSYEAGVARYLQRALVMMRRKQLPERLCEQWVEALGSPVPQDEQRAQAAAETQRTLGLSEAQLVCLLFAPFINRGAGLERFLRQCHPGMLVALPDLHRAMQGQPVADQIMQWMVDVSGLPVSRIGQLYGMQSVPAQLERVAERADADMQRLEDGTDNDDTSLSGEWSAGR